MEDEDRIPELKRQFEALGYQAFPVSAAARTGFDALLDEVSRLLPELPPPRTFQEAEEEEDGLVLDSGYEIRRENEVYVVEGPAMQRLIDSVNFDDEDSMNWFHRTLRDRGIINALREKGAGEGSTVRIEDMEFDFVE
jgi:GTP-binding protein